jgi:hypothetical protein
MSLAKWKRNLGCTLNYYRPLSAKEWGCFSADTAAAIGSNSVADNHLDIGFSGVDIRGCTANLGSCYSLDYTRLVLARTLLDMTVDSFSPCFGVRSKSCCQSRSCSKVLAAAEEVLHFLSSLLAQMLLTTG